MRRLLVVFVLVCSFFLPTVAGSLPVSAQTAQPTASPDDIPMEPITEPWIDPEETLDDAFEISIEFDPVASEIQGTTQLQPGEYKLLPADVALADFYAEVWYLTPEIPAGADFSIGFCFWFDPAGNCYDVYLQADAAGNTLVGAGYWPAQGDYRSLMQTSLLAELPMEPAPGVENVLGIVVYDGYAILTGNDFDVLAVLALPDAAVAGKVKSHIGFIDWGLAPNAQPLSVTITDLSVWDLSSGLTPTFSWLDEPATPPAPTATPQSLRPHSNG